MRLRWSPGFHNVLGRGFGVGIIHFGILCSQLLCICTVNVNSSREMEIGHTQLESLYSKVFFFLFFFPVK